MKVLHVDSARGWRGGQNQVLLSARGMARKGHAVVVAGQERGALAERARAAGLEVREVPFQGDLSPAASFGLRRVVSELRPDVVHAHDPHAISAALLAGAKGVVATRRVDFPLKGLFSRIKYRACRRVVAVSEAVGAVLAASGIPAAALRIVYEGVPDRPPAAGGRAALAALGVPEGALVIGNVAALTDHKDHATLLEAAARVAPAVPRAWFVLAGEGELRARLEAQARALGVADRVIFAGFRDDLDRLIPAFDVFCLSSHMEGLGTSLLDAMCFARPVVATAAGGIPEAVQDGETGRLVPPRDPEALAAALREVLEDEGRRDRMGAAGRRRFEARFTDERMVDETLAVYAEGT